MFFPPTSVPFNLNYNNKLLIQGHRCIFAFLVVDKSKAIFIVVGSFGDNGRDLAEFREQGSEFVLKFPNVTLNVNKWNEIRWHRDWWHITCVFWVRVLVMVSDHFHGSFLRVSARPMNSWSTIIDCN